MIRNSTASTSINRQRLRATLRLCFMPEQADALAARLAGDDPDSVRALAPIVRMARLTYTTNRWLAPLKPRPKVRPKPRPLRPRPGLPTVPALALALHLGLSLDIASLSRLFRSSSDEIAAALQRARQELDTRHISPCAEFVTPIGHYRDPSPDRFERLEMLQHVENCERCQLALEHARKVDDSLLNAIGRAEDDLVAVVEAESSRRSLWLGPVLLWGGVALLVMLIVATALAGSHRLLARKQTPVPLLATDRAPAPFTGWLLETTNTGDVRAVNLASGARRLLIRGQPLSGSAQTAFKTILSPDGQRIAQVSIVSSTSGTPTLRIYAIDGSLLHEWNPLNQEGRSDVAGWLDATRLLVFDFPAVRADETTEHYRQRLVSEGQLLTLDIDSGERQVIARGWIIGALPSPDRSHIAIVQNTTDGMESLQIHPLSGNALGDPVGTTSFVIYEPTLYPMRWTPDSKRVVFLSRESALKPQVLETMTIEGQISQALALQDQGFDFFVGVSPDSGHLIYVAGAGSPGASPWAYWQVPIDGGDPVKLADSANPTAVIPRQQSTFPLQVVSSPDGNMMAMTVERSLYLPQPQSTGSTVNISSFETLAYDSTGRQLGVMVDQLSDATLLGWLPETALGAPPRPAAATDGSFHQSSIPVQGMDEGSQLTTDSRVSPDGTSVLIYDDIYDLSMFVSLDSGASPQASRPAFPQVAGAPIDPSWLPDSSGVIGVQHHTANDGDTSAITIWGLTQTQATQPVDYDPARIGNSTSAAYRCPMLAPNGLHYSFFVARKQAISLWVGGYDMLPKTVANWNIPTGAKVELPLISAWVGNETLIFAQPDQWSGGFPQHVSLQRITIAPNGLERIDPLLSWRTRGGDRGVALQELRVSSDRAELAIRLRHYTGNDFTADRFDTIIVAGSDDLRQSVEIARGSSGDGISWSPDGTELAAFIKDGLEILSSDGSRIEHVQTNDSGYDVYPVWVLPNEIWFQQIDQGRPIQINQVTRK